jgi:hypothetical protein
MVAQLMVPAGQAMTGTTSVVWIAAIQMRFTQLSITPITMTNIITGGMSPGACLSVRQLALFVDVAVGNLVGKLPGSS